MMSKPRWDNILATDPLPQSTHIFLTRERWEPKVQHCGQQIIMGDIQFVIFILETTSRYS
jgi:hypothetical protein